MSISSLRILFTVLGLKPILALHVFGAAPQPNPPPSLEELRRRQAIQTDLTTCGYLNGDVNDIRTANSGFHCLIDTVHDLWGFCPVSQTIASDCGLAGRCVDLYGCSSGCGLTGTSAYSTVTCADTSQYCSTALLNGYGSQFLYVACGATAETQVFDISPTTTTTTSSSISSTSTSSITTQTGSTSSSSTSQPPNNTGAIVGGVVGGIAVVGLIGVAVLWILRRGKYPVDRRRSMIQKGNTAQPSELYDKNARPPVQELPG